jgi:hypothetical protein
MRKKAYFKITTITFLFLGISLSPVLAHDPPVNGKQDCGLIVDNVFYSEYYSPPQGTPATNGSCSWIRQSNVSCGRYNYNGTNYTLYPYKFICNLPFDNYTELGLLAFGVFGFYRLRNFGYLCRS